jgi:DNA polymerase phi
MDCLAAAVEEDVPWREEAVRNLFEEVFGDGSPVDEGVPQSGKMWTPEKIALALRAQRLWPGREQEWRKLWAPTIKHGDVLHIANLMVLARVLRVGGPVIFMKCSLPRAERWTGKRGRR